MVGTGTNDAEGAIEAAFETELGLAIDGIPVVRVAPTPPGFAERPLSEQIDAVKEMLRNEPAIGVTWLSFVSDELVLVHVVVVDSGRILVKMLDSNPQDSGFAVDLAMASRELLGLAFLLEAEGTSPQVKGVTDAVAERVMAGRPSRWWVLVSFGSSGGVHGHVGPSVLLGGALALERHVRRGFRLRVSAAAQAGPLGRRPEGFGVRTVLLLPSLGGTYLWSLGKSRIAELGPSIELRPTWTSVSVTPSGRAPQSFSQWGMRGDVTVHGRFAVHERVRLVIEGGLGFSPLNLEIDSQSTGELLVRTPYVWWTSGLGVAVSL